MIFSLVPAIIFSASLFVILRYFAVWKINTLHGIIFNYYTAALVSVLMMDDRKYLSFETIQPFWYVCAITGFLFIVVFFITGLTTHVSGVAAASIASKMSMVIPITAGYFLYQENLGMQKITGILIAIPALILSSIPANGTNNKKAGMRGLLLPIVLFIGAGIVDTTIKFTQHHYMNEHNMNVVIMSIFASAGIVGSCKLVYDWLIHHQPVQLKSIAGGILLGTANYFSLYFLLKCLDFPGSESSTIFALVNIGVVMLSFFAGLILFKEPVTKYKLSGAILALVAIIVLSY